MRDFGQINFMVLQHTASTMAAVRRSTRIRRPPLRLVMNMDDTIEHYDLEPVTPDLPADLDQIIGAESSDDHVSMSDGTEDADRDEEPGTDDENFLAGTDDDDAFAVSDREYTPSSESDSESIDESDEISDLTETED